MDFKIIAVDFDGTLCENKFPNIGAPNVTLINRLKGCRARGDKLILWTCRVGEMLNAAVNWCAGQGLEFDAVNENLPEVLEAYGSDTRKIYAHEYIDDKAAAFSFLPRPPDADNGSLLPEPPKADEWNAIADMDDKALLKEINKAIFTILAGGQSYKIGTLEVTRASLARLYDMKKQLEAATADDGSGGIGRRTAVGYFGRR